MCGRCTQRESVSKVIESTRNLVVHVCVCVCWVWVCGCVGVYGCACVLGVGVCVCAYVCGCVHVCECLWVDVLVCALVSTLLPRWAYNTKAAHIPTRPHSCQIFLHIFMYVIRY